MTLPSFLTPKATALIAASLCYSCAFAAEVQIYGLIDEGFSYIRTDADNGQDAKDSFVLSSSITQGSRFGIKGSEDLANGLKVGFILENGFEVDSGEFALATSDRMFGREASLYVDSAQYGQIAFGRLQHLTAGYGTWGVAAVILNPFAIGWGSHIAGYKNVFGFNSGRFDNGIAYKSPTLAGFTLYAQYSGNTDQYNGPEDAVENKGSADRYGSVGVKYAAGAFTGFSSLEWSAWSNARKDTEKADDGIAVTLGGNYAFDFGTLYLAGQYFDNQWMLPSPSEIEPVQFKSATGEVDRMVKGWGVITGAKIPAGGGDMLLMLGMRDAELVNYSDVKVTRVSGTVGYMYPLSKRTYLYSGVSYTRDDQDKQAQAGSNATVNVDPDAVQAVFGMCHSF